MFIQICVIFVIFVFNFTTADNNKDSPCVTPNGESATCEPINSCSVIRQALAYLDSNAIDFAKHSRCGSEEDGTALVCCGTTGRYNAATPTPEAPNFDSSQEAMPIQNVLLPDRSLCGIHSKQNRILGGTDTEIDEFPWMVVLKYAESDDKPAGLRCAGTLINDEYVLTAAQCLFIPGLNLTEVRLGEWNVSSVKDCVPDTEYEKICADPVEDIKIIEKIPHPFYTRSSGNNDIALLRMEKKVNYTEYIRPICLPPIDLPPPFPGTIMDISGWGFTETGTQSEVKLKVKVPMVANKDCLSVFPDNTHINPNQACAGGERGKDACNGDSGGPLMRTYDKGDETNDQQWYQEGIIYRGVGCGQTGVPALYTRVSRYVSWILNTVKKS